MIDFVQDRNGKIIWRADNRRCDRCNMAEWDGILAGDGINNFYFYRFKETGLGYVLPKDKDHALRSPDFSMLENIGKNVLMRRLMEYPEMKQFYTDEILRAASIAGDEGGWLGAELGFADEHSCEEGKEEGRRRRVSGLDEWTRRN